MHESLSVFSAQLVVQRSMAQSDRVIDVRDESSRNTLLLVAGEHDSFADTSNGVNKSARRLVR